MRRIIAAFCLLSILEQGIVLAEEASSKPPNSDAEDGPAQGIQSQAVERNGIVQDLDALFLLQDATARGRRDAASLQKPLLVSIGERLAARAADLPDHPAPYVAGYVLSGGDPATAEALAKSEDLIPSHKRLLEGVALFMRGDRAEAAKLLNSIDTSLLPARIGGRVALAQALLEKDPAIRQAGLAVAMASMPGTLVEESALRRSALAFAESDGEEMFWKRLERYQRRFPDSLYAMTFWQDVIVEIVKLNGKRMALNLTRLDLVLQDMPVSRRRDLYLHLTRESARVNDVSLVEFAASRTRRLAVAGGQEDQAAKLYLSLYAVASEKSDEAVADLQSLNRNLLGLQERTLLDAGLSLAQQIRRPPSHDHVTAVADDVEKTPLQMRAEKLLVEVEETLLESNS